MAAQAVKVQMIGTRRVTISAQDKGVGTGREEFKRGKPRVDLTPTTSR